MSTPWAEAMCSAWNADTTLTGKLVESGWMKNDAGRGFKAMQIYRLLHAERVDCLPRRLPAQAAAHRSGPAPVGQSL